MKICISIITIILLSACASPGVSRDDLNTPVTEFYASIVSVKPIILSSEVGTGIVVGATYGALDNADGNTEDIVSSTIVGALIGGLITAIFEGSNNAFQYQLVSQTDGELSLIQKEELKSTTGCVKVRVGAKTSMQVVDSALCS